MREYLNLPCRDSDGNFNFVVEAPRGSIVKWKFDPRRGAFVFQRSLLLGVAYPYDWGFIPSTRASDGDPIDAMLLFDAPSWPGVVIPAKPIGIVCMTQKEPATKRERNDRIMMMPTHDPRYSDVKELPKRVRKELEQFFVTTSEMTDKNVTIDGWEGPKAAEKAIDKAAQEYAKRPPDE